MHLFGVHLCFLSGSSDMPDPIKVIHITYDMRIGGTEQVIKNIVENTSQSAVSQMIYCIESPLGPWGKALLDTGIPITSYDRTPKFDWSLVRNLRRKIVSEKIDILHCHQYTPYIYGLVAAFLTKAKVIFTEHGRFYPDSSSPKRLALNPIFEKATASITAISRATKNALVEFEGFSNEKIEVIYNSVSDAATSIQTEDVIKLKKELGLSPSTTIIGTIARLDPIKNQVMMVDAFSSILSQHSDTVLLIVGDGPEMSNLRARVDQLSLTDKVFFTGYQAQPQRYLAAMDIYLLSSLSEGTSMTLLEAMSFSKPCVVTDAGGNSEIILDGKNGIVTPNDETKAFAAGIDKLLSNRSLLAQMGIESRKRFCTTFSVEHMITSYQELYRRLLRK